MTGIIIAILSAVCLIEFIYICVYRKSAKKLYDDFSRMFNDAINGQKVEQPYDESMQSALFYMLQQYINLNKSRADAMDAEKAVLQETISNISHQMAQPISSICVYSELLAQKQGQDENADKLINNIYRQSEKLRFLFDVMLKTSKLEAGIITLNKVKKQSVKKLIVDIIQDLINSITQKNINIYTDIAEDITADFDFRWTKEAVYNILENAVKYTPVNGTIRINVINYETCVRIDISDTGIGIAKNEYNDIFKRFYRSKEVSGYSGLGIGLYLSREILSKESGYIKVSSVLGKGSTFSVFIPH